MNQINLFRALGSDLDDMGTAWDEIPLYKPESTNLLDSDKEPELNVSESSSVREVDSGVESGTGTGMSVLQARVMKYDVIPLDVFIAAPLVRVMTYHLVYASGNEEKSVEQNLDSVVGVTPLALFLIGQPYFVLSTSYYSQRIEFSIFDLSVGMGQGQTRKLVSKLHF